MPASKKGIWQQTKEWLKALAWALSIYVVFRLFLIDFYIVPTSSMESSILPGDFIIASKLAYGPRIPITPLSLPFGRSDNPHQNNFYSDLIQLPYWRLPGFNKIQRNDVVVFNYPMEDFHPVDQRTFYVKRCVALPGDTFEVRDGSVFIANEKLFEPEETTFNWLVKMDTSKLKKALPHLILAGENDEYILKLTLKEVEELKANKTIIACQKMSDQNGVYRDFVFPQLPFFEWNLDFYGPLIIPAKGDSVVLDEYTLPLYQRIIEQYEQHQLEVVEGKIFIDGKEQSHYRFEMDYYFMMGDNRQDSGDSRFWGFVPENHIVAKPLRILFSKNESDGSIRWSRIMKAVK